MGRSGKVLDSETGSFGCKVTHNIMQLDLIMCLEKVGANTSQKGDGAVGGEKYMPEKGITTKEKFCTKCKHWTLLGLTNLDGTPVMCIVILAGKEVVPLYAAGINCFTQLERNSSKADFFAKNSGPGKLSRQSSLPLQGSDDTMYVPLDTKRKYQRTNFSRDSKNLDVLGVYDEERERGLKHMLCVDAHGSRLDLSFLEYINNPVTKWAVYIGVPYGTSLWQVSYSTEHNRYYKMVSIQYKR